MTAPPIYLDYAATTPVDPRVTERMAAALDQDGCWANASSIHELGVRARQLVEDCRATVAEAIGAHADEVVFTSGATESDNLAILGVARHYGKPGSHVVTSRTEHKAVLDTCRHLEREGFRVTYLEPDRYGRVATEQVAEQLRDDTVLVSIMHVNNEIGVIQDVDAIGRLCRERGVVFHVDGAQAVGHVPVDMARQAVDLLSVTAHKVYGPKGIGALFVRRGISLAPLLHGGEQERGMRPGTLPNHQIAGLAEAFRLAGGGADIEHQKALSERLMQGLLQIPDSRLNGHPQQRSPHIVNVAFAGVHGESLRLALSELAVSAGAACSAADPEASYVLRGLGLSDVLAQSSLRFSVGRFTREEEVDRAVVLVASQVERLRALAPDQPRWCAGQG